MTLLTLVCIDVFPQPPVLISGTWGGEWTVRCDVHSSPAEFSADLRLGGWDLVGGDGLRGVARISTRSPHLSVLLTAMT